MEPAVCHLGTARAFRYTAVMMAGGAGFARPGAHTELAKGGRSGGRSEPGIPGDRRHAAGVVSADGSTLYARTAAGKVYATADFDTWRPAANAPEPLDPGRTGFGGPPAGTGRAPAVGVPV